MSTDLTVLFNPILNESIVEKHTDWIDIQLLEGFEDDRDIHYSKYSHEISLCKLAKSVDQQGELEFIKELIKLEPLMDISSPPCMVMNCDILVGFMYDHGKWDLVGESSVKSFEMIYYQELMYIMDKLCA